ncbi:MAG: hypothetical protein HN855_13085 [Anaerolineae bacterium]|jgi:hypothetical protein|nr:hypothetical protein [Anaerolineae bacterium]MBT7073230.1 hypothetical protein [Anaerolineae bacterium]MBT7326089.1 hypothetical protein [Anaerolineae bacterium]
MEATKEKTKKQQPIMKIGKVVKSKRRSPLFRFVVSSYAKKFFSTLPIGYKSSGVGERNVQTQPFITE